MQRRNIIQSGLASLGTAAVSGSPLAFLSAMLRSGMVSADEGAMPNNQQDSVAQSP